MTPTRNIAGGRKSGFVDPMWFAIGLGIAFGAAAAAVMGQEEMGMRMGPPSAAEQQKHAGPWDQDILVYRVPSKGPVEYVTKFERGGVATTARLDDGRLIAAHQHFPLDNEADFDKVAVHLSTDEGRSWTEARVIGLRDLPAGMRFPFDPTLVPLPDGKIRLYFTSTLGRRPDQSPPSIYSAISSDGLDYTFEPGVRFGVEGRPVIDCSVVLHQGVFHLYSPDNGAGRPVDGPGMDQRSEADRAREGVGYHAVSKDGLNFERAEDVMVEGRRRWLGNAQSDGEKITFYGTGEGGVWTATSTDGHKWTLGRSLSGMSIADPGTVALKDGALLVIGTSPPRPGTPSAAKFKKRPR